MKTEKQDHDFIKEIVKAAVVETVKELRKNGLLKRSDDVAYAEISERLFEYYRAPEKDPAMEAALDKISGDYYFPAIKMYYQNKLTIDWIAEDYHVEISTVSRNKKRLCLRLYRILY